MMDDHRIKGQLFRNHHIIPKISFEGEGSDPDAKTKIRFGALKRLLAEGETLRSPFYRAALATRSTLSFLFMAKLRTSPFEAAMISSARQLAADRLLLKADL